MDIRDAAVIDFETLPIGERHNGTYSPAPVGVAVDVPGERPRYYGWGHPSKNNCGWGTARAALGQLYDSGRPLVYHNAKFDLEVAREHMDLPVLPLASNVHDTVTMLFLDDPRAPTFQLKSSSERILGMAPDERDVVVDWLIQRQPVPGMHLSNAQKGRTWAGAYVGWAPGDIAGRYAIGDVRRTRKLLRVLWPRIKRRGMLEAYAREQRLLPHLMLMEARGVRVDVPRLHRDVKRYQREYGRITEWILKRLGSKDINLNSGPQVVEAMTARGLLDPDKLQYTDKGNVKTGKDDTGRSALEGAVKNRKLLAAMQYRTQLGTCLHTFMENWLTQAEHTGRIYTTWNSTRVDRGGSSVGTRTGRLSSTPNFQNIPTRFDTILNLPIELLPLPYVRGYIIAEEGHVLIGRDYSQQELRMLGHYSGGQLLRDYMRDPWLDIHTHMQHTINRMLHTNYKRKPIKNNNFGMIYGMGLGKLAAWSGTTVDESKKIRDACYKVLPGLRDLQKELKRRAHAGEPIRTWGGREYYCEKPKLVQGRMRQFDYKMLNLLIQPSSADATKEGLIRYCDSKIADAHPLLTVHDELLVSVPKGKRDKCMGNLRQCMESIELDIPLLTEGVWSPKRWEKMKTYDKKGKRYGR